ncbi:hypothetical protein [Phocaeicola sp.]
MNKLQDIFAVLALFLVNIRFLFGYILEENTALLTLVIYAIFLLSINYKKKPNILYIVILFFFLSIRNQALSNYIVLLLFCIVFKEAKLGKVAFVNLITQSLVLLVVWFMLISGNLHESVYINGEKIGYDFGFGHCNAFANYIYAYCCNLYVLLKGRGVLSFFLIMIISLLCFQYSMGRTYFIGELILLTFMLLSFFIGKLVQYRLRVLLAILPVVFIGIMFYISIHLQDFSELNYLMTGRFDFAVIALTAMTPLNWLFGIELPREYVLDNSYIVFVLNLGLVFSVFFLCFFMRTIYFHKRDYIQYYPFIISMLVTGIGENVLVAALPGNIIFWLLIYKMAKDVEKKYDNGKSINNYSDL